MSSIKRFEDILGWQKARELTREVYALSREGEFARDFAFKDQIRSAAISIMSNIAEGFERGGDKEFIQFLAVAKGSSGELRAQLYAALDQGYLSTAQFQQLCAHSEEVSKLLAGFMDYLRQSELRGSKFR